MDHFTKQHFQAWLTANVPPGHKQEAKRKILALLSIDPGLLEGRSWPELLRLAENSCEVA